MSCYPTFFCDGNRVSVFRCQGALAKFLTPETKMQKSINWHKKDALNSVYSYLEITQLPVCI